MKKWNILTAVALILIVGGLIWYTNQPGKVWLAAGDTVKSWTFKGAYTDNPQLTQRAQTEIARLQGMLGSGQFSDYELDVSIANQYDLLGDGKQELNYLEKALAIDSEHSGLAWYNAAQLMTRFGALRTAKRAFDRLVTAQPTIQYRQADIDFLKTYFPDEKDTIATQEKAIKNTPGEIVQ